MSTNVDFNRIKSANNRSKFTVYGFVHQYHPFYLSQIIDIILCFYYLTDEWDSKHIGQDLQLLADHDMVIIDASDHEYGMGSAYLTNIISHGIFSWRFKIIQACDEMNFGIRKCKTEIKNPNHRFFNQSYTGYIGLTGDQCTDGDIVEMILNLDECTLRFKVNDIHYGVPFKDIEKTRYRAAIFMFADGYFGRIQLLQ